MKHMFTQKFFSIVLLFLAMQAVNAQPFVNPIPIPNLVTGNIFNLTVQPATHNFNPNVQGDSLNAAIRTYCYNETGTNVMSYLGPTMVWRKGQPLQINVTNDLNTRTTVHWHGLNLPSQWDGGPHEIIESSGGTWQPHFSVIDPIQTVWYHSHLMDTTTLQVILGLAGMIIIEDPVNDNLRALLPHDYNANDFPIVIQEKGFNFSGGLVTSIDTAGGGSIHTPGNGTYTLINGVVNGVLRVPPQMVRLRVLNGSPRKSFQVGVSNKLKNPTPASFDPMWLIATDGGYTGQPYPMDSTLISPGERMEFLVDFTTMSNGDTLYLSNLIRSMPKDVVAGSGGGGGATPTPVPNTPGNAFLAIIIDSSIHPANPVFTKPDSLLTYTVDTSDVFKHRKKLLMGGSGTGNPWTIDGDTMDMMMINDTILVNKKEMWTIQNTTNVAHPFHIHKVQFQVVEYEDSLGNKLVFPNLPRHLMGYKDDALVRAKSKMTFIAVFDSFPDNMIDPMFGFMYHCHILTHEDNSMMHQFVVVDSTTYYGPMMGISSAVPAGQLAMYPNPAGNVLNLKGTSRERGTLRFVDLLGRTLREEKISAFDGTTSIDVQNLPRGIVFVEWTSEGIRYTQKMLLQ
jgi:FtsP/CotA-like multicopper oxidase with cupredoxin domain